MKKFQVRPLGKLAAIADVLMTPIMYIVAGTFSESPQRTHFWNNTKLGLRQVEHLKNEMMVACKGAGTTGVRFWLGIPLFHLPIFGGWKNYVVLQSCDMVGRKWHVGWIAGDVAGVSRIELRGPGGLVRMLIGPGDVSFFGVNEGEQIPIRLVARGRLGDGGRYRRVPLL